jgi:hypothetical protein
MAVPDFFKKALAEIAKAKEREKLQEAAEKQKEKEKQELFQKREDALLEQKVGISSDIFAWKDDFLRSEEGAEIFRRSGENLWVFGGGWAHVPHLGSSYGRWSRIYFTASSIVYNKGYKWMSWDRFLEFQNPGVMAEKLGYQYLKDFLEEIRTEKVYGGILRKNSYNLCPVVEKVRDQLKIRTDPKRIDD